LSDRLVRNDGWRVAGLHLVATSIQHLAGIVVALALHGCGVGTSISGINIPELRFADDMSLLAESEHYLQDLVDHLHAASSRFGLKVSNSSTMYCQG